MTKITKRVDRGIPSLSRTQQFTQVDAVAGDILMIADSLGHPAHFVTITATDEVSFRLNTIQMVYPRQPDDNGLMLTSHMPCPALGQEYQSAEGAITLVGANATLTLDNTVPIDDLELVTVSGVFDIFVA
jgi:hypothetical protein